MLRDCCGPQGCSDCCAGEGRPCACSACSSCCQPKERVQLTPGGTAMQGVSPYGGTPQGYLTPRRLQQQQASFPQAQQGEVKILQALTQERVVEIMKPETQERIIEVPQKQFVDTVVEVPQKVMKQRIIHVPKPVIHEVIKHVKKPVVQETVVEVPQTKVVERYVDVPQFVIEEKYVKVPKIIMQERVVPVPTKVIKEKICEIDMVEYKDVIADKVEEATEPLPEKEMEYRQVEDKPYNVEKVIDVPHVQHVYRNVMTPQYRHIPKAVEVPMTHYRPVPVEKIVDRNVPVPVELQIVQEYLCPKIEPVYKEQPLPVHVQRIIEHPVPKEAMNNRQLLPLYYQAGEEAYANAFSSCCQPGGCLFSMSPCCASQEARITQGPAGGGPPVEVLAQGGYPGMPIPGAAQQAFQQPYGREISVSSGGTMQMSAPPPQEEQMQLQGGGGPYVQVSVTPNPPGVPTSVTMS